MRRRTRWIAAAAVAIAAIGGGTGIAAATAGDDHDQPITGDALTRASAVAIAHAGGGRVTGSEVGDEEGYYEVEVTLPDGRQVDMHLGRDFRVLTTKADQDTGAIRAERVIPSSHPRPAAVGRHRSRVQEACG